ncbi:MAG TPA: glutamate ABC transporter substrate-binding protein [Actinomycetota bacterium]|jgi:ABC-type amino acid transport substrate-binding protein|nr:glutamate ABC transporter substrate-binding protein [Actinomycetota bacterium]
MRIKRFGVVLVIVGLLSAACGNGDGEDAAGDRPEFEAGSFMSEIQDDGELVVGVKFDVPQFGFRNPTTDEVEGFDTDFGREIAKAIGVEPKFVEAISANRIPFLQQDKVDIVFSTMTVNDERKKQIDFSDVYYVASQSFLTRKGETMTVDTAAGKKVCTAKGSTSELNLPAVQPDVEIVLQDGYAQCVQLLRNQQVDAVSTDDVILLQFVKQSPDDFEVSDDTFSTEPYGAGMKKGHPEFVEFVNGVIQDMKRDGRWADLYAKWITPVTGDDAPEPPPADVKFQIEGLEAPVTAPPASPTASP